MSQKRVLSECPSRAERLERARAFLAAASKKHKEFAAHDVVETVGDGMCFFHALAMELRLDSQSVHWEVAAALLYHLSRNVRAWRDYVDDEYVEERVSNLKRHGLARHIERQELAAVDLNAYVYILDRCCGIVDRDWGCRRLYCDGFLIEQFSHWMGCRFLLLRCSLGGRVDVVEPHNQATCDLFTFKMAHYGETPEHFNVISKLSGSCPKREEMREKNSLRGADYAWACLLGRASDERGIGCAGVVALCGGSRIQCRRQF